MGRSKAAVLLVFAALTTCACNEDGSPDGSGAGGSSGTGGKSGSAGGGNNSGKGGSGGSVQPGPCSSCSGCCDGSTCLPLASQSKLSCGKGGSQCQTCNADETCDAGACVLDKSICSPKSCPDGCCTSLGKCDTSSTWLTCSKGGQSCEVCEPYALCSNKTCDNDQWGQDAQLDLYIDGVSVSEAQCSDILGTPDPIVTVTVDGKAYAAACPDAYSCTFSPPIKIGKIGLALFLLDQVKFTVEDSDDGSFQPCWSGDIPLPDKRDFGQRVFKPGDGSITYHLRPAGY